MKKKRPAIFCSPEAHLYLKKLAKRRKISIRILLDEWVDHFKRL